MRPMLRVTTVAGLLLGCVLAGASEADAAGAAPLAQATTQISAADAAPFLGDWTLALQGPNGPGTFALSVTADKGKIAAEIGSEAQPKQPISDISLRDTSLVLNYSFLYEGNPVDAVVTLTPDKDGKTRAQIDFAGGAYVMDGTATKKAQDKDK